MHPIKEQIEAIATKIYGADGVDYQAQAEKDIARMEQLGFGAMPVCMAKTHLSLSHDPQLLNRPTGYRLPVRGVVPSAGAGFVVVLCGDMQRMPGLGRTPAFMQVDLDPDGRTVGPVLTPARSLGFPRGDALERQALGEREEVSVGIAQPELPGPHSDLGSPGGLDVLLDLLRRGVHARRVEGRACP